MGRPLGAQARSTIELGVSYVRFPLDSTSITGPSVRWLGGRALGPIASTFSVSGVASGSGVSGYAEGEGRWLTPLAGGWRGELAAEAGALLASTTGSTSPGSTSGVMSARV